MPDFIFGFSLSFIKTFEEYLNQYPIGSILTYQHVAYIYSTDHISTEEIFFPTILACVVPYGYATLHICKYEYICTRIVDTYIYMQEYFCVSTIRATLCAGKYEYCFKVLLYY